MKINIMTMTVLLLKTTEHLKCGALSDDLDLPP